MLRQLALAAAAALILTAAAAAATKQGDPRVCRYNRPAYCAQLAAAGAFKAKYQRVMGRGFIGSLQCRTTAPLTYLCVWKNAVVSGQTVVRFADKAPGWTVSVGVIQRRMRPWLPAAASVALLAGCGGSGDRSSAIASAYRRVVLRTDDLRDREPPGRVQGSHLRLLPQRLREVRHGGERAHPRRHRGSQAPVRVNAVG